MIRRSVLRAIRLGMVFLWAVAFLPASVRGQGLTTIASFNGTNGNNPSSNVTIDANGNLFGTAGGGGANNAGTVWEIAKGSSTITTIASFNGTTNGYSPRAGVTIDANGNLLGTTYGGGAGGGTVWEIAKGSSTITTIASFNGANGYNPSAGVTIDANGNLLGTTVNGGAVGGAGGGTVWQIAKGSSTLTALADFNITNGIESYGNVTIDAHGNLYGTAAYGGANNAGTVWEIAKGSSTLTAFASFNGTTNGDNPFSNVTIDANGNLFGTTAHGGANNAGTVWEIAKGSSIITTLASFNGTNGSTPSAGVTINANGNLFGTTYYGGAGGGPVGDGAVWELTKGSSAITTLASFIGTNGANPDAGVTIDANGNLLGTTQGGGANNAGTVWEIQMSSVPEPSSIVTGLIGMALAGGFVLAKRASARREGASRGQGRFRFS